MTIFFLSSRANARDLTVKSVNNETIRKGFSPHKKLRESLGEIEGDDAIFHRKIKRRLLRDKTARKDMIVVV
jgi:hypothetical protein